MSTRRRRIKQIKSDLERKRKIQELIDQGYELNEAIIMTQKKISRNKKLKLQKHIDIISKNAKDKGRRKSPITTNKHGRIIYLSRDKK